MENTSAKWKLNSVDFYKSLRGFGITVLGVFITYVASIYMDLDYGVCFTGKCIDLEFILIPIIGGLLELGRRFITNYNDGRTI